MLPYEFNTLTLEHYIYQRLSTNHTQKLNLKLICGDLNFLFNFITFFVHRLMLDNIFVQNASSVRVTTWADWMSFTTIAYSNAVLVIYHMLHCRSIWLPLIYQICLMYLLMFIILSQAVRRAPQLTRDEFRQIIERVVTLNSFYVGQGARGKKRILVYLRRSSSCSDY